MDIETAAVESQLRNHMAPELLLDEVREFIARFCIFPTNSCLDAVTLWVAHAHMVSHFHTSPRLALLSPEPASGKTRVLEILELLCPEAQVIYSPTVPAIFRKLAKHQSTLLFDECDTIFSRYGKSDQNEDLRAMLNSGYKRGATIPRCVGPNHDVQDFDCFAAVAMAGLGQLPQTILSRSIIFRMRRRSSTEKVESFRHRLEVESGHQLRDQLAGWASEVGETAGNAYPELPSGVEDRTAEVWEPIIAVADQAGDHWPSTARKACLELIKDTSDRQVSLGMRLLQDIREVFGGQVLSLSTKSLLGRLNGVEAFGQDDDGNERYINDDAPWCNLRGNCLDSRSLANLLKPYGITSTKVKIDGVPLQGYRLEDLRDAWSRYLPENPAEAEPVEPGSVGSGSSGLAGDEEAF